MWSALSGASSSTDLNNSSPEGLGSKYSRFPESAPNPTSGIDLGWQ